MTPRSLLVLLPLAAGCHARPESLLPGGTGAHVDPHSEYLRGRAESFVVLGDAESFVWPALLQDLLDAHAGKTGLYRVLNGAAPADGIGAWTSVREPGAFRTLVADFLAADAKGRAGAP